MRDAWTEIRQALRRLASSPGFTIVTVSALALGLAAALTLVSLADATVFRPLPGVRDPGRVFAVGRNTQAHPAFEDFRQALAGTADVAAFAERSVAVGAGEATERLNAAVVSGSYFPVLGVRAEAGRMLGAADDAHGAPAVVVVSADYARSRLGGDAAVGKELSINGRPFEVVGIADPEFRGLALGRPPEVWIAVHAWSEVMPTSFSGLDIANRGWGWLRVLGRYGAGADAAQVAARIEAEAQRQLEVYPDSTPPQQDLTILPAGVVAAGFDSPKTASRVAALLLAVAALVILVAVVNAAQLLHARFVARSREIATRMALGAGRGQLALGLFAEPLLLGAGALVLGLLGAAWTARGLGAVVLPGAFRLGSLGIGLDSALILLAAGLAFATALAAAVGPLRRALRSGSATLLRGGEPEHLRAGRVLVALQVALTLVLVVGAGLLGRAVSVALANDFGFEGRSVVVASVDLGLARYDGARAQRYYEDAIAAVEALPEVEAAGWTSLLPLSGGMDLESFALPGRPAPQGRRPLAMAAVVSPRFFEVLGAEISAGRAFTERDTAGTTPVAIVNEAFVRKHLEGGAALGQALSVGGGPFEIVGVVRDLRVEAAAPPVPALYAPLAQFAGGGLLGSKVLVARAAGDPREAAAAIGRALGRLAPEVPVFDLATFGDVLDVALAPQRLGALVLGGCGAMALALAALGIYGTVSYDVTRRSKEIGVRVALGATPHRITTKFTLESLLRVCAGLAAGVLLVVPVAMLLRGWLFGVSAADPITYLGALALLAAVGGVAALVPALRAARLDPVRALREE